RYRVSLRTMILDGLLAGTIVGVTMVLVVVGVGLAGVLDQIVAYPMESRDSEGWSLWKNRIALARALSFEPAALPWLGAVAGVLLLSRRRLDFAIVVGWAAASVALLLLYSPLHGKHAVVMIPPIAVAAGVGLAEGVRLLGGSWPRAARVA